MNYESLFDDWMKNLPNPYTDRTRANYIGALRNAGQWFGVTLETPLLELGTIVDLQAALKPIYALENYEEINAQAHHYTFSAAVNAYEKFLNSRNDFTWIPFYTELADKLQDYEGNREQLISKLVDVYKTASIKFPKMEKEGQPVDIDPFTVFGMFNKGITDENRTTILQGVKNSFGIEATVPTSFPGIPVLNNLKATFFYMIDDRGPEDINNLWQVFKAAIRLADSDTEENRDAFVEWYDKVRQQQGIRWNITMGLFWIRPYYFVNLDARNRTFIQNPLNVETNFAASLPKLDTVPTGQEYLLLCKNCRDMIEHNDLPYSSIPEMSAFAWSVSKGSDEPDGEEDEDMPNDTAAVAQENEFETCLNVLKEELPYVEDQEFSWDKASAFLIFQLSNTDSLNKVADNKSNATQIQLTSGKDEPEGSSKTEDFFPTLTLNKTFSKWRLEIPARINIENIKRLGGQEETQEKWKDDTIQIRRRILNEKKGTGNPTLHICYEDDLMPLRQNLNVNDYLVIVKLKGINKYYAFGVRATAALGSVKRMVVAPKADNDTTIFSLEEIEKEEKPITFETKYSSDYARNRIIFGAPGTGKSFTLREDIGKLLKDGGSYERVTFHPDYSYANFVGTYKPVPEIDEDGKKTITYTFVAGPFMRVYVEALKNSRKEKALPYVLAIEEINRANVAAVFGDIFQLLDRDEKNISEYPIHASKDVKDYLAQELGGKAEDYSILQIPDNMFIWATMNSADQGVFPMDTAFKRRWDFTYKGINDSETKLVGRCVELGLGTNKRTVEWNALRRAINDVLSSLKINEDKLLGPYFISRKVVDNGPTIDSETFKKVFKSKVLMYLFDDAAKQRRSSIFANGVDSTKYSSVCEAFDERGIFVFCTEISNKVPNVEVQAPAMEEGQNA